jgi:hypothetical protein
MISNSIRRSVRTSPGLKPLRAAASTWSQALATFARRAFPAPVISGIRVRRSRGSLRRTIRPARSRWSSWVISVVRSSPSAFASSAWVRSLVLSRALSTM